MKKQNKHQNGLEEKQYLTEIVSADAISIDELKELAELVKKKFQAIPEMGIFYLDYGIVFGKWQNNKFEFYDEQYVDAEYLQQARIFNENRELKVWRIPEGFRYRLRDDTRGEKAYVVEATQYLWGTKAEQLSQEWTRLTEDRGTELIVPSPVDFTMGEPQPLAFVKTRNYVGYLENGQATYEDCRFVKIGKR